MTGYFIYGDVDTRNYEGIVVSEDEVDSAPERAYEEITIVGRNGTLLLDGNRYENVIHSYDITVYDDYVDNLIKLRNDILSKVGYQVLRDSFNPDEKYLARVYTQVIPKQKTQRDAGNMHIEFSRKPQRFLVDGDREILPTEWTDLHTVTGDMVTVESDGSLAVKSLEVSLSPIQDLNGYDKPWVGGAGKNKIDVDAWIALPKQTNWYSVADGVVSVNANDASAITGRTLQFKPNTQYTISFTNPSSCRVFDESGHAIAQTGSQTSASFTTTASGQIAVKFYSSTYPTVIGKVQIEEGNTATAWEPYENLCPISGGDSVDVVVSPTQSAEDGTTYTTALGRTVYGGTLDVTTGVLTVDRAMVDLGPWNWTMYSTTQGNLFRSPTVQNALLPYDALNILCSHYPTVKASLRTDNSISVGSTGRIDVIDSSYSDTASFKTAMNGVQLVYELATPQTYQLTPQQVELLTGTNHLWSDGEITLTYGVHPYHNPTPFDAKPLIKVTGTGTLGIGEYILTITGTASQTLYIDCETMEIYTLEGTVPTGASSLVSINKNDFPVLEPGTNYISVGSGITAVTITPRWWRI